MTAVPYRLRRIDVTHAATALLLLQPRAADLLQFLAQLDLPTWPEVFAVRGGFLIKLPRACEAIHPAAMRLRRLSENLFLPADAELEPGLLPDEAVALVRSRGLIVLPGGEVLGFSPAEALQPTALLSLPRLPACAWRAFPPRPERAEQLREVVLHRADDEPDLIIERGGAGPGTEEALPAGPGPFRSATGHTAIAIGRGLLWLANLLRWERLARFAAGIVSATLERIPRISESVLGRQEAALRLLLREFREGQIERALRRALPVSPGTNRGTIVANNAELPRHDPRFSLRALLSEGRGPRSVWLGGGEVQAELASEYRKAAAEAAARGDHRRAAFIYGKLLGDFRLAAAVLERGGLHHDAAILYLEKLHDTAAAAKAFAATGEFDRSLQLFRQLGDRVSCGDLYRRMGDEEAALAEFTLAAEALVARGDYLGGGSLLQKYAARDDLARAYFAAGWSARPGGSAVACLLRLTELCAASEELATLLALADEADAYLDAPGKENDASQFYDHLVRLAGRPQLAPLADDIRDRSLMGIARQLRRRAAEKTSRGTVVSSLIGRSGLWDAAVVSDADFAFKGALQHKPAMPGPVAREIAPIRLAQGTVTAACAATETGVLFAGFSGGRLIAFEPASGATTCLCREESPAWPVVAVATDPHGDTAVTLRLSATAEAELCSYQRVPFARSPFTYAPHTWRVIPVLPGCGLTPVLFQDAATYVGLWDGATFTLLSGADLVPVRAVGFGPTSDAGFVGLLVGRLPGKRFPNALRAFGGSYHHVSLTRGLLTKIVTGWSPGRLPGSSLYAPALSILTSHPEEIHVAGIDQAGVVCHSLLRREGTTYTAVHTARSAKEHGAAVGLTGPGRLGVAGDQGVAWLRSTGNSISAVSYSTTPLNGVAACFFSPPTHQLLILGDTGELRRLAVPF